MKNFNDKFDREFERTSKLLTISYVVGLLLTGGTFFFFAWAIIKILQFFGII